MTKIALSISAGLALILSGCLSDEPTSVLERPNSITQASKGVGLGGISENAPFSKRVNYFDQMPTRKLCEMAIVIESLVEPNMDTVSLLGPISNQTPVVVIDGEVHFLAGWSNQLTNHLTDDYSNATVAMNELSERYASARIKACPEDEASKNKSPFATHRMFTSKPPACMEAANAIKADDICPGTYQGRSFSKALLDTAISRAQSVKTAKARRDYLRSRAPVISCTSSTFYGTTSTVCY